MAERKASIDPDELRSALERVRADSSAEHLEAALESVMESAQDLFGSSGAGLMFIDENHVLTYLAATDAPGERLERMQQELGEGPCVDALIHGRVTLTRDVASDERWPELARALADEPVHAVLGIPVRSIAGAVGSLNIYLSEPYEWSQSQVVALQSFGGLVETFIAQTLESGHHAELAGQLQQALDNRVEIERAVGVIMGREGLGAVEAFNRLRGEARNRREKAAAIAKRILGGEWPLGD